MKFVLLALVGLLSTATAFAGNYSCSNEFESIIPMTFEASIPRFLPFVGEVSNVKYTYTLPNGETKKGNAICEAHKDYATICTPADKNSDIKDIIFHYKFGPSYEINGVQQIQFVKCKKI